MLSVLVLFKEKNKLSGITTDEALRDFSAQNLSVVCSKIISLINGFPVTPGSRWETHQIIVLGEKTDSTKQGD